MGRKRAIICFETEERFESVTDAANAIGASWSLVSSALKRHGACRGFHFYYADEVKPDDSVFDRKVYKNSRPIICLETNERFESQARGAMTMDDCGSEKTICYEEDGWSVTLTRYVSMELGETVASWVEFPNGWYLHSDDADAEFTQDGAKTYLQRLKSVWMESPFWDSVKAMEEKPQ